MKLRLFIPILALLGVLCFLRWGRPPITYYVQTFIGDVESSGAQRLRQADSRLLGALRPVFCWTNYCEISRCEVRLKKGKKIRIRLSNMREAEIDLTNPRVRQVTAFQNGTPLARVSRPVGNAMTILGGDNGQNDPWFIVVRRDKPMEP